MGLSSCVLRTQTASHRFSVGQTRAHIPPKGLLSKMVWAEPRRLPSAMRLMKEGTSMLVGQAVAQGASKQYKQRSASSRACEGLKRGLASAKREAYSSALRRPARRSDGDEEGWDTLATP